MEKIDESLPIDEKYVPMFNCFQRQLVHTKICVKSDTDYDDFKTFLALRHEYRQSLGRLRQCRNFLALRSLSGIERVEVKASVT
jgi:hypothetical protein